MSKIPAYKDEQRKSWYASFYFTDFNGDKKKKTKRGFKTKKEALEFEREFLNKSKMSTDMNFESLVDEYMQDMSTRLKLSTIENKKYLINTKILPTFGKIQIKDITATHIRKWQNNLLKSNYSQTYIKTINNQLVAILNYAVKYYNLPSNPVHLAGSVGKKNAEEMAFWTLEEFKKFIEYENKLDANLAFKILFWTGIRLGELLALTPKDVSKNQIDINKSYLKLNGEDIISTPKTPKSKRVIPIPSFLYAEIENYLSKLYNLKENERIFKLNKSFLFRELNRCCKLSNVKKIRIHDLRHSHASLLVNMDINILTIAERLGHENAETTWNTYSHLYPNKQLEVAKKLEVLKY
ncbi:tyrosine-type recombinase/integrase [Clostridioides difficile]|uniref:tyrosine-type recombinase/integrase n=1 Tax=Clostridioides difficile TaxID=1496 RepID=UPI0010B1C0E3|nr:site-specific integrase [Clostridioides difficile]VHY62633.1 phage integrase [Clostridioides difficile]VHY71010.1 phage integrase [Clostridioides difficile]